MSGMNRGREGPCAGPSGWRDPRLLEQTGIEGETVGGASARRTVTVNRLESPLGWLRSRGHISERQFLAGERLRTDWERAQLAQRTTMAWDVAPVARTRGGSPSAPDLKGAQLDAKARFEAAIAATGSGLADILWRVVCAGEGMRAAENALGWPVRSGKLVLTLALDRVADYYRIK